MISQQPQGAVLRLGKVVKVHPSDHSIDLVMMDNGAKMANVQLLAPTASTRSGRVDLPEPELPDPENPWSLKMSEKQDLLAAIAMMGGTPICIGFLYPQVNELAMEEDTKNLRIDRHASDFYQTIDDKAVMTMNHPCGAYLSIGGGYNDLKKKDFDKKWEIKRNKEAIATVIHNPSKPEGGETSSSLVCDPNAITMKSMGGVNSAEGAKECYITAKAIGDIKIFAKGEVFSESKDDTKIFARVDIYVSANQNAAITSGGDMLIVGSTVAVKGNEIFLN